MPNGPTNESGVKLFWRQRPGPNEPCRTTVPSDATGNGPAEDSGRLVRSPVVRFTKVDWGAALTGGGPLEIVRTPHCALRLIASAPGPNATMRLPRNWLPPGKVSPMVAPSLDTWGD